MTRIIPSGGFQSHSRTRRCIRMGKSVRITRSSPRTWNVGAAQVAMPGKPHVCARVRTNCTERLERDGNPQT